MPEADHRDWRARRPTERKCTTTRNRTTHLRRTLHCFHIGADILYTRRMPDRDDLGGAWKVPPSRYLASRPAEFAVGAPTSVYVTMPDGCRLAVDVILPNGDAEQALADRADPHSLYKALRAQARHDRRRAVAQQLPLPRHVRAARLRRGRGRCARHRRVLRHARFLPIPARARRLQGDRRLDRGPAVERRRDRRHRHLLSRRRLRFPRQHRPQGSEGDRAAVRRVGHLDRQLLSRRHADQAAGAHLRRADAGARSRPPRSAPPVQLLRQSRR